MSWYVQHTKNKKNYILLKIKKCCRPKNKYIRITKDENFRLDDHYLSNMPAKAEKACSYDLDDCDIVWLRLQNGERASMGKSFCSIQFYLLLGCYVYFTSDFQYCISQ